VKNRGAAMDDAATSILAGSQWGGDLVLSVGAWWPAGVAFYHITCRTPAAARGVPGGSGRHDLMAGVPKNPTTWRDAHVVSLGPIRDIHAR
jgi:hypothetical protein